MTIGMSQVTNTQKSTTDSTASSTVSLAGPIRCLCKMVLRPMPVAPRRCRLLLKIQLACPITVLVVLIYLSTRRQPEPASLETCDASQRTDHLSKDCGHTVDFAMRDIQSRHEA